MKKEVNIRLMADDEVMMVATLLAKAYADDVFFAWCVPDALSRGDVVRDYYAVYLKSRGAKTFVAVQEQGIVGAMVWLPHDADARMYEEISQVVGVNAPMFDEVAVRSHANEPTVHPFFQLVGFGVEKDVQGLGMGRGLLSHALGIFDEMGVPTYLEASTLFNAQSVYARFGYAPFGELMHFSDEAVLYPLYRKVLTY